MPKVNKPKNAFFAPPRVFALVLTLILTFRPH